MAFGTAGVALIPVLILALLVVGAALGRAFLRTRTGRGPGIRARLRERARRQVRLWESFLDANQPWRDTHGTRRDPTNTAEGAARTRRDG